MLIKLMQQVGLYDKNFGDKKMVILEITVSFTIYVAFF